MPRFTLLFDDDISNHYGIEEPETFTGLYGLPITDAHGFGLFTHTPGTHMLFVVNHFPGGYIVAVLLCGIFTNVSLSRIPLAVLLIMLIGFSIISPQVLQLICL